MPTSTDVALRGPKRIQSRLFLEEPEPVRAKPFLKWAGGKTRLLPALQRFSPPRFNRYFEPFLGGGAFFFHLSPMDANLGDSNPELVSCYEVVRDKPEELIAVISKFRVTEHEFYRLRELEPENLTPVVRAARMIFLNKTCYNGLYRVNRQGKFNTPYGQHSRVTLVDPANIM